MSMVSLRGRLLHWGNSYGLRLTKGDVERLRLRPDTEVDIKVEIWEGRRLTFDEMPTFDLGGDASARHDEIFGEQALREHQDATGQGRGRTTRRR